MDKTGKVTTYINQRGENKGMIPRWLSAGVTHQGMGANIGDNRQDVAFGRIFGDNARADVSTQPSPPPLSSLSSLPPTRTTEKFFPPECFPSC